MKSFLKYLVFAIIYTVGYFFLALLSTGGGHGNLYLLTATIPWIFLLISIFSLDKTNKKLWRIIFIIGMILHYGVLSYALLNHPFSEDRGWTENYFPLTPIIWYFIGQLIIWFSFVSKTMLSRNTE